MLVPREWAEQSELFEAVVEALDEGLPGTKVRAMLTDGYGSNGSVRLVLEDGRVFHLRLAEEFFR